MRTQKVFVLRYSHEHGHDIGVYSTRDRAVREIGTIMQDNAEDFREGTQYRKDRTAKRREFTRLCNKGHFEQAGVVWEEATGQYFEIYERTVV